MPRKFPEIRVGDVVGDFKVIGGFRDKKNDRRMIRKLIMLRLMNNILKLIR